MADNTPKTAPEALALQGRPQGATRLNRLVVGGGLAVLLAGGVLVTLLALQRPQERHPLAEDVPGPVVLPEGMRGEATYAQAPPAQTPVVPPQPHAPSTPAPLPPGPPLAPAVPTGPSPEEQARDAARKSGIFFPRAQPGPAGPAEDMPLPPLPRSQNGTHPDDDTPARRLPPIVPDQAEKRAFLTTVSTQPTALKGGLEAPRSPYEIKAGWVIPAVLLTGVNSDLPGELLAQVREHVFDTVSGRSLLIPQGSKLVGTYDSAVIYGQDRVLVVWSRVILPNGDSISLENMPGVDLSGYAGFRDTVNHHWGRLLGAVVLSSVLNIGTRIPAGDVAAGRFFPTLGQEAAQDVGQGIGRAGQQVVQRQLSLQPTITIRPGFVINVFVHRDMTLRPYQEPGSPLPTGGPQP